MAVLALPRATHLKARRLGVASPLLTFVWSHATFVVLKILRLSKMYKDVTIPDGRHHYQRRQELRKKTTILG